MDYQTILLLITFVSETILIFIPKLFNHTPESTNLPPGPPFFYHRKHLGNCHKSAQSSNLTFQNLWTSYDFKLSSITTIIISSPQVGKQVLHENGQVFSSRTIPHSLHALDHHKYSVVFMPPSPKWRNLRRVCATKIFSPQVLDSTQILRQQIAILVKFQFYKLISILYLNKVP